MLERIIPIADQAGHAVMRYYGTEYGIDLKADDSPLTQADLASHRLICDALAEAFPDIPICSEEGSENGKPAEYGRFWLVDPLDGTKEFIKRTGSFTVNIALIDAGVPVLGVVHAPAAATTYCAARGEGAWRRIGDSSTEKLRTAVPHQPLRIVASRDHAGPQVSALLERFPDASHLSIGSSLKFCLVAAGEADVYLRDIPTMEWDTAAAHVIVTEAGGALLTWPQLIPLAYAKPQWRNGPLLTVGRHELAESLLPPGT